MFNSHRSQELNSNYDVGTSNCTGRTWYSNGVYARFGSGPNCRFQGEVDELELTEGLEEQDKFVLHKHGARHH